MHVNVLARKGTGNNIGETLRRDQRLPPLRLGSFLIARAPAAACGCGAAAPIVKETPPGAGGAAPNGEAGGCVVAGLGWPNEKPVGPPDEPGG